jgi:hypothetical protein
MSEYGPALFVSRADGAELPADEQAAVLHLVQSACRSLKLKDDDGNPVEPQIYDYNEYENGALGVLLYSSHLYGEMPEEVQADYEQGWTTTGARLANNLEKHTPGTYKCVCYGVEN